VNLLNLSKKDFIVIESADHDFEIKCKHCHTEWTAGSALKHVKAAHDLFLNHAKEHHAKGSK
jgi:hypothetical protein